MVFGPCDPQAPGFPCVCTTLREIPPARLLAAVPGCLRSTCPMLASKTPAPACNTFDGWHASANTCAVLVVSASVSRPFVCLSHRPLRALAGGVLPGAGGRRADSVRRGGRARGALQRRAPAGPRHLALGPARARRHGAQPAPGARALPARRAHKPPLGPT